MQVKVRVNVTLLQFCLSTVRAAALAAAALLPPAALMLLAMAVWRLAADMRLAEGFIFSAGTLSHWQAWAIGALALQGAAWTLNRLVFADPARASRAIQPQRHTPAREHVSAETADV